MALQWSESFDAFHHKEATSTKLSDMAAHVSRVGEKILRLDVVFKKAIDVASNSLNNADLDKCFGDFKSHYGNALPNLFMNMIAKSQVNIEASYKDICAQWKLEEVMQSYEVHVPSSSSSAPEEEVYLATAEDPLSPSFLLELKKAEAEGLKEAIQKMKEEIRNISEATSRLRSHINNQILAVSEEGQKLSSSISS